MSQDLQDAEWVSYNSDSESDLSRSTSWPRGTRSGATFIGGGRCMQSRRVRVHTHARRLRSWRTPASSGHAGGNQRFAVCASPAGHSFCFGVYVEQQRLNRLRRRRRYTLTGSRSSAASGGVETAAMCRCSAFGERGLGE